MFDMRCCHFSEYNILKGKGKGVLLHAMEVLGGRGGIAPAHT
jgi:hypothetical protein